MHDYTKKKGGGDHKGREVWDGMGGDGIVRHLNAERAKRCKTRESGRERRESTREPSRKEREETMVSMIC